eukprot:TRINITY_DN13754_c0_g1_i2.p1 TRINITY_DN13754_c0_g1~~TRINITY_DN13754_c0_g1_i2.p1  ORF type:complete len:292 (+),score=55.24 TRINITY_DN13754_c0_g1_i2:98-973(+)
MAAGLGVVSVHSSTPRHAVPPLLDASAACRVPPPPQGPPPVAVEAHQKLRRPGGGASVGITCPQAPLVIEDHAGSPCAAGGQFGGAVSSTARARQPADHTVEDDLWSPLFPSRPVVLPDELRGALLLPSESDENSTWNTDYGWEDMTWRSAPGGSGLTKDGLISPALLSVSASQGGVSESRAQDRGTAGGTGKTGADDATQSSVTALASSGQDWSVHTKVSDWSLGDSDVRELLEKPRAGHEEDAMIRVPSNNSVPGEALPLPANAKAGFRGGAPVPGRAAQQLTTWTTSI